MAYTFQICDGVIEMSLQGKINWQDFRELLQKTEEVEARLPVTPNRITDMRDADVSELLSSDVAALAHIRRTAKLKNKIKSAIIATKPEHHGLARVFMGINQNPDISIMLFKDPATARAWLGGGKPTPNTPPA